MILDKIKTEDYELVKSSVEDVIRNTVEMRSIRGRSVLSLKDGRKDDEFISYIKGLTRKYYMVIADEYDKEDVLPSILLMVMYCLISKKGMVGKDYNYIQKNDKFRRELLNYIGVNVKYLIRPLLDNRVKVLRADRNNKVYVKIDETSIDGLSEACDFNDFISSESEFFKGEREVRKVSKYVKFFNDKKDVLLNDKQLRTYNSLKDDFQMSYLLGSGDKREGTIKYMESKGVDSRYFYGGFRRSLNLKFDRAIEEGEFSEVEKISKRRTQMRMEVDSILGREDLSDETINVMLSHIIGKYHDKDGMDLMIEDGLDKLEIVDLVRCVKSWENLRYELDVHGDVVLKGRIYEGMTDHVLGKRTMYKIVDNIFKDQDEGEVFGDFVDYDEIKKKRESDRELKVEYNKKRKKENKKWRTDDESVVKKLDVGGNIL